VLGGVDVDGHDGPVLARRGDHLDLVRADVGLRVGQRNGPGVIRSRIADAIGTGLEAAFDVRVVPVSHAEPELIVDADLVVVGGPTHGHGMSRASTRKAAVQAANKPIGGLTVEPDAMGPGLREWFGSLGDYPVRAAAFDTRMHGPAALTGRAAKGVSRLLRQHGFDVVAEPESFLVTKQDRLEPQEQDRARDWGVRLAATIAAGIVQG
jgi:hypothetical protein